MAHGLHAAILRDRAPLPAQAPSARALRNRAIPRHPGNDTDFSIRRGNAGKIRCRRQDLQAKLVWREVQTPFRFTWE